MNKKEVSNIFLNDVHLEIITGSPMIKCCQCKWGNRTDWRNELSVNYLTWHSLLLENLSPWVCEHTWDNCFEQMIINGAWCNSHLKWDDFKGGKFWILFICIQVAEGSLWVSKLCVLLVLLFAPQMLWWCMASFGLKLNTVKITQHQPCLIYCFLPQNNLIVLPLPESSLFVEK